MPTIRRQSITGLRPIMADVLRKYFSDVIMPVERALELEKELAGAAYDYFYPNEEQPHRYDLFTDPQLRYRAAMVQRIEDSLKLNTDDTPEWERVIDFCLKQDQKGETIETYAYWCKTETGKYNAPKAHQIVLKPSVIIGTWRQAFTEDTPESKGFNPQGLSVQ